MYKQTGKLTPKAVESLKKVLDVQEQVKWVSLRYTVSTIDVRHFGETGLEELKKSLISLSKGFGFLWEKKSDEKYLIAYADSRVQNSDKDMVKEDIVRKYKKI